MNAPNAFHSHRWKIIILKRTIHYHYHKFYFRRKIIILKRPYVLLILLENLNICLLFISSIILSANPGKANVNLRQTSNTISWRIVMCDTLKHDTADLFLLLITVVLLHFLWFQCGTRWFLSLISIKEECHYLPYCPA